MGKSTNFTWDPERLRKIRKQTGFSEKEIAKRMPISYQAYLNYERGGTQPGLTAILELSDYFGVTTDYFLGRLSKQEEAKVLYGFQKHFFSLRKEAYEMYLFEEEYQRKRNIGDVKAPYPYNLVFAVLCPEEPFYYLTDDQVKGLDAALASLKERERIAVKAYYEKDQSLDLTGKELGVTRERARQIIAKAIRELRYGRNRILIENGFEETKLFNEERRLNKRMQQLREKSEALDELLAEVSEKQLLIKQTVKKFAVYGNILLEDLNLSVRSYNCLGRFGCRTFQDVLDTARGGYLMHVKRLGMRSLDEICKLIMDFTGEDCYDLNLAGKNSKAKAKSIKDIERNTVAFEPELTMPANF